MSTRQERVKELLKIEISDIIRREIKDPRLGFVTVTDAEVSKDLRHARVFISIMGDEKAKQEGMEVLQRASHFIRGQFAHRVAMKVVPEIVFKFDTSVEQGARIFELLQKVKDDEEK